MTPISADPRRSHIEPLWDRVDANRLRLTAFVVAFVTVSVASFDVFILVPITFLFVLRVYGALPPAQAWAIFWGIVIPVSIAYGAIASGWAAFTLLRSEKWLLKRLDATLIPRGEHLDTKMALKDMAIAAGLPVAPALHLIDVSSTNAFLFAARRRRAVVGVTSGFIAKLSVDERRAVFANLVARLKSGDTITSTGVTALMWPVHAWRSHRQQSDNDSIDKEMTGGPAAVPVAPGSDESSGVVFYLIFGAGFAILSELIAALHRRSQRTIAETADAEGMLLLKDPASMLSALSHCVELNNLVPSAGEAFSELFYCWTGVSTNDEDDPEWQRVARLREVLGVEGAVWSPQSRMPAPEGMSAPIAPRVAPDNETNRLG